MKVILRNKDNIKCNIVSKIKNYKLKKINMFNDSIIEDAISKRIENFSVHGKSEQNTTVGKNLLNLPNGTYTKSGITAVVEDGKITLNGTANALDFLEIPFNFNFEDANYTLSINNEEIVGGNIAETQNYACVRFFEYGRQNEIVTFHRKNNYRIHNWYDRVSTPNFTIRTAQGLTYNNFVIYPQLEKGNEPTSYEPYTGGYPSPNPDYPQKIESISGIENLIGTELNVKYMFDVPIKKGESFTISTNDGTLFAPSTPQFRIKELDINGKVIDFWTCGDKNKRTITRENDNDCYGFMFDVNYYNKIVMVERGSVAHNYVPYNNKYLIYKNQRKNLLKFVNGTYTNSQGITAIVENGKWIINGMGTANISGVTVNLAETIVIPANTTFILSGFNENSKNSSSLRLQTTTLSNPFNNLELQNQNSQAIITNSEELIVDRIYLRSEKDIEFNNFVIFPQLELGNIGTEYEPYKQNKLDIPLNNTEFMSIGDVYDELIIDSKTGDYYKLSKINEIILNGSETLISDSTNKLAGLMINDILPNLDSQNVKQCSLTDHFTYFQSLQKARNNQNGFTNYQKYVYFNMNKWENNIEQFKQWLSENNTVLHYVLENPILTKIGTLTSEQLENLKLFDGYNNITFVTGLDSEQEISYFTKEFVDILNYKYSFRKVDKL